MSYQLHQHIIMTLTLSARIHVVENDKTMAQARGRSPQRLAAAAVCNEFDISDTAT